MSNKKSKLIKALVVGLGNIGFAYDKGVSKKFVFSHTRAYLQNKRVELLAGIDPDKNKRAEFSKIARKAAFVSVDDFINKTKEKPDIVSLCVPTAKHLKVFQEVLLLKPKMVILEKPLSFSLKQAKEIVSLAEKSGVEVVVNYQRRFNRFLLRLRKDIKANKYGRFVRGSVKYRGGVYNSASHAINFLSFCLGDLKVVSVFNKKPLPNGDFSADFILQSKGRPISFECFADDDYDVSEYDLFFEKARVKLLDILMQAEIYGLKQDPYFKGYKQLLKTKTIFLKSFLRYQVDVLEAALKIQDKKLSNPSDVKSAFETMRKIEEIKCKRY